MRGFVIGGLGPGQKNEAISTEIRLIHAHAIIATTTTMGKP